MEQGPDQRFCTAILVGISSPASLGGSFFAGFSGRR
jgi:hypothetical protein